MVSAFPGAPWLRGPPSNPWRPLPGATRFNTQERDSCVWRTLTSEPPVGPIGVVFLHCSYDTPTLQGDGLHLITAAVPRCRRAPLGGGRARMRLHPRNPRQMVRPRQPPTAAAPLAVHTQSGARKMTRQSCSISRCRRPRRPRALGQSAQPAPEGRVRAARPNSGRQSRLRQCRMPPRHSTSPRACAQSLVAPPTLPPPPTLPQPLTPPRHPPRS